MAWATRYDRAVADLRTEYEERYAEGLQLQFSRQAEAEQRLVRDAGLWRQKVLHEAARHSEERDEQVAVVLAQRQESLVAMSQRAHELDYEELVAQVSDACRSEYRDLYRQASEWEQQCMQRFEDNARVAVARHVMEEEVEANKNIMAITAQYTTQSREVRVNHERAIRRVHEAAHREHEECVSRLESAAALADQNEHIWHACEAQLEQELALAHHEHDECKQHVQQAQHERARLVRAEADCARKYEEDRIETIEEANAWMQELADEETAGKQVYRAERRDEISELREELR